MKIFNSKSQAAMDFLMTYAWAILVVAVILGVLAYFGILSPSRYFGDECVFLEPNINCVSHKIESSKATLVISNKKGRTLVIKGIDIGDCKSAFNDEMVDGSQHEFVLNSCNNGAPQAKLNAAITVRYTEKDTSLAKTVNGHLSTKIE